MGTRETEPAHDRRGEPYWRTSCPRKADSCRRFWKILIVELPGKDGFALLREIRDSAHRETRVLAVTAHALPPDSERAIGAAFDGYVRRPVDIRRVSDQGQSAIAAATAAA
jgi:CheY-like chemotaxis protein